MGTLNAQKIMKEFKELSSEHQTFAEKMREMQSETAIGFRRDSLLREFQETISRP